MPYSKEYIENIKYIADMIDFELDIISEHIELIKPNHLDTDYYEGVERGIKDAHNIVSNIMHKALTMQLEVKGGETE